MQGDLKMEIQRGSTNRRTAVDSDFRFVQRWAQKWPAALSRLHLGSLRLRREIASAPLVRRGPVEFLRGRRSATPLGGWEVMGPPPSAHAVSGRYNAAGTVALYLSTDEQGVRRELERAVGDLLAIQRYRVDTDTLRILDATEAGISNFLHAVFDHAEGCCIEGRGGPMTYHFSQNVARIAREAGFDGMLVPGVRGDSTTLYQNLSLFDCGDRWRAWSLGGMGFRQATF